MIEVTAIGGDSIYLNADLIEKMESVPDTLLHLVNGHSYMVRETIDEVLKRIQEGKKRLRERFAEHFAQPSVAG